MLDCNIYIYIYIYVYIYIYILLIIAHNGDVSPDNCVITSCMNLCHNHEALKFQITTKNLSVFYF